MFVRSAFLSIFFTMLLLEGYAPARLSAAGIDQSNDIFGNAANTVRARGMGFSFSSLGDDASVLFINPAALVTSVGGALYFDYGKAGNGTAVDESRGCLVLPLHGFFLGAGFYKRKFAEGESGSLLVLGLACKIAEGTPGSFLSVGANLKAGSYSYGSTSVCSVCPLDRSDIGLSADAGIMIRPLPMVSFSYVMENIREVEFNTGEEMMKCGRASIWGISWFWKEKIVISWERENRYGSPRDHFGFSLRTLIPLEVQAGFYSEKVTGGLRWRHHRFNIGAAFSPGRNSGVFTSISIEIHFDKAQTENHQ